MIDETQQGGEDGEALVLAMTRPTMIGGFTLASLAMSFYFPGMAALITRSLWAALLVPVFLLASYLVCLKDVYLFDILSAAIHLKTCPNKRLWGCRRYAPR
jgi:type IV secretion system protein VirB3